jgi:hypothetical protein
MNRNTWILLGALLLAFGVYATRFTDWVSPTLIQIEVSTRPSGRAIANAPVLPTLFLLDREYAIQSLVVTAISNVPPSRLGKPVWHLSANGTPHPVRGFAYGEPIKGLKPLIEPSELIPGATYRVDLKAGRQRGSREFKPSAPIPLPEPAF